MSFLLGLLGDHVDFSNGKSSPERQDKAEFPVYGSNGIIGFSDQNNAPGHVSIIGRVGTYCGSIHFSKQACWVTDNAIKAIAKNAEEARFWHYAMLNCDLHDLRAGSGQPLINQSSLKKVSLPVPPKSDRLDIAAILGALDDKIEENRKTAVTLEAMARALYRSWFVDFDPVWAKLEGRTPAHMDPATAALFPDSFEGDGLPEEWTHLSILDAVSFKSGKTWPTQYRQDDGDVCAFGANGPIGRSNMSMGDDRVIFVGKIGSCGAQNYYKGRFWASNNTYYITKADSTSLEYVRQVIHEIDWRQFIGGSSNPYMPTKNFDHLMVLAPPTDVLLAFEVKVDPLRCRIEALEDESQTLAALRDSLLPRLMSGQLRVDEAREQIEEVA